jgi:hypothetical protein
VFVHSRFIENPLIDLEVTNPTFLRWFYHTSATDVTSDITEYYGVLQKIIEYTFGSAKELRVVFFYSDWLDTISGT